ncbi:acyl-CoA dehydrogenase [Povalibacter uvarum]|uniref:3-methylmercaptopropionyl-CoA dehydrogenase n=1 Tax=Povalibacter uvarum TaxID=732238 RepID=A0A841HIM7_9GAMM|nr:acyl-CoA dehydrogenase [Povalibacter uvarum]MBB6092012.1 acyl-CoA dehydrogenase [Povalibacter uvarum]
MYKAPLKDLRFVMHNLLGDDQLAGLPGLEEYSPDFTDSVLEEAGKFAEEVLQPINRVGDTRGAKWTAEGVVMPPEFKDAYAQFAAGGWAQLRASPEHGGQGAPTMLGTAVEELWASANLAFKLCPMLSQSAVEAIERCGTPQQKETYLPKMISGEWTGTMVLTEPQAGSDLAAIRTRAVREGDHYRLHGSKIFITYGDHDLTSNTIHLVLGRVEGAPAGVKGISLFIVPKVLVKADGSLGERNDVRCVSIEHKLGIHGSPTCVLSFGDKQGAVAYLVGEENRGLEYMFIMMNAARLSVGLEGYALAERSYQHALAYARTRVQGRPGGKSGPAEGKPLPIAYHQDIKRMLLTMKGYADAARAIALYAALQLDLGRRHTDESMRAAAQSRGDLLIPIVKGWSTEMGLLATSLGVQIHGGMGFIEETGAAQYYRDVRITTIYEGTTGIQAGDLIGRKVGRDAGAAMNALIADMLSDLDSLKGTPIGAAAIDAVRKLREATQDLLDAHRRGPEQPQAVAVPYLLLCGFAIGGWLMAKSDDLTRKNVTNDAEFNRSKQQIARAYVEHILPQAQAYAAVVKSGSTSIVDADPALF